VDGVLVASRSVNLAGRSTQQVSFTLPAIAIGNHTISIDSVTRNIVIGAAVPPEKPFNWWLVAGCGALGLLLLTVVIAGEVRRARFRRGK